MGLIVFLLEIVFLVTLGCAGSRVHLPSRIDEKRFDQETCMSDYYASQFETYLKFKEDKTVSLYLSKLAQALLQQGFFPCEVQGLNISVIQDVESKWVSYGLPGIHLYLATGILRNLHYEHEVAAFIALELATLKKIFEIKDSRFFFLQGRGTSKDDFFGAKNIFTISDSDKKKALKDSIEILYTAKFDPRGVVSFLELLQKNSEKILTPLKVLLQMIEIARREISHFLPLKNSTIRSNDFLIIQERLQKL